MGEVFITRKGGGGKSAAPTLAVTSVGGSFVQLAVTNNDAISQATIFILANYDTNSATDFDLLATQSGTVINVAANTTVSTIVSGLDPDTSHTVSAQAAVIKKLPSSIVTTNTINLSGTGIPAPTVGPITENLFTSTSFNVTNNDTVVSLIIKTNITTSTTAPTVYPFESSSLAPLATGSITVSGLTSATVYYIHARAFDGTVASSNVVFGPYTQSSPIVATGGTTEEYDSGGKRYKSHTFLSNGTFSVTSVPTGFVGFDVVDVLVVAGGGGGGSHACPGGGGAGGLVHKTGQSVTAINYGITVGAGGAQSSSNNGVYPLSNQGANSTALSLTAVGGGGGVTWGAGTSAQLTRINGGSTGGYGQGGDVNSGVPTAQQTLQSGESGSLGFGNRGGNANFYTTPYPGGGGGGAGAVGQNSPNGSTAGAGGVGRQYDIRNGTLVYYAGGGGGGGWSTVGGMLGGLGGGGRGDCSSGASGTGTSSRGFTNRAEGEAGAVNTGGGGGAAGRTGGQLSIGAAGGSGIVVIRYEILPV